MPVAEATPSHVYTWLAQFALRRRAAPSLEQGSTVMTVPSTKTNPSTPTKVPNTYTDRWAHVNGVAGSGATRRRVQKLSHSVRPVEGS